MSFSRKHSNLAIFVSMAVSLISIGVSFGQFTEFKLQPADGVVGDYFGGGNTSLDGTRLALGAHQLNGGTGAVYVFEWNGTNWIEKAKLFAGDGQPGSFFGSRVSLDGDRLAVGALDDDNSGVVDAGAVYVFEYDGTSWQETAKLVASDAGPKWELGRFVALEGNRIVAGAIRSRYSGFFDAGAAYVFEYDPQTQTWSQRAVLTADPPAAGDLFGINGAMSGDRVVVGNYFRNTSSGSDAGSAHVFVRDSQGVWTQEAELRASDGQSNDVFGYGVGICGDLIAVGAPAHGPGSGTYTGFGAVYVFRRDDASGWQQEAELTTAGPGDEDYFGYFNIAVGQDWLIAGSYLHSPVVDGQQIYRAGAAYVFKYDGVSWIKTDKLVASDANPELRFGPGITANEQFIVIGPTPADWFNRKGVAYVYAKDIAGPIVNDLTIAPSPVPAGTPVSVMALVDETASGGGTIESAEYTVDGGTPAGLAATDGVFDEVTEAVQANLSGFSEAGLYEVCVTGSDEWGNVGAPSCAFLPVYDASAGSVTGTGWIWSPAGAYASNPSAEGRAHLGFYSKYTSGASQPTGATQFQFLAGDLQFHSENFDWLVVAGAKATFKGMGTINGGGSYKFMVTAGDGDLKQSPGPDTFRIRIWEEDVAGLELTIYDNQIGAQPNADATTVVSKTPPKDASDIDPASNTIVIR